MIMNPKGRAKVFRRWAEGLRSLGYKESAKYWQSAAEDLERKEVMTMGQTATSNRPRGLYHKFFVLNLWSDPLARKHARGYADDVREENPELAADLYEVIAEAEAAAKLTEAVIRGIM